MPLTQITPDELLAHYTDEQLKRQLRIAWQNAPTAEAIVLFENVNFDSPERGAQTSVVVGPDQTIKSVAACEGKWLKDLPSQRQYAQSYCVPPRPWLP